MGAEVATSAVASAVASGATSGAASAATSAAANTAAGVLGVLGLGFFGAFQMMCCFGYLLMMVLMVGLIVFWIRMIIDVVQRSDFEFPQAIAGRPNPNERLTWVLVVVLLGWIGGLIYYYEVMRRYPRYRNRP